MTDKWVLIRRGEVTNVFDNRREAVKYFKEMLNQMLNDFKTQDISDEYDYSIEVPEIEIKPVKERKSYLGL